MPRSKTYTASHSPYWKGLCDGRRAKGYAPALTYIWQQKQDYARGWSAGNAKAVYAHLGKRPPIIREGSAYAP